MLKLLNWRLVALSLLVLALLLAFGRSKRVSAQQPPQFEYEIILARQCATIPSPELCVFGRFGDPPPFARDVLTTLSSQGFELVAATQSGGMQSGLVTYTLRRPVAP